jgi:uncharacterized ferredoxin-like protein
MFIALVTDDDKCRLQDRMRLIGERDNVQSFVRDAGNLDHAPVVVLIGTRKEPLRLPACGYCGFDDCNTMQSPFRRKVRTLSSTGHKIWLPLPSCELAPFRLCL